MEDGKTGVKPSAPSFLFLFFDAFVGFTDESRASGRATLVVSPNHS